MKNKIKQTLKERIKQAGFKTKKEFAEYIGKTPMCISKWGDNPPLYAERILQLRWDLRVPTARISFLESALDIKTKEVQELKAKLEVLERVKS